MTAIARLDVHVDAEPLPGLLRPAIDAALSARPFPTGPEHVIGGVVADAVAAHLAGPGRASAPPLAPAPASSPMSPAASLARSGVARC